MTNAPGPGGESATTASLGLLGRFSLVLDGNPVDLAASAQRVLALLALMGGAADRRVLAGTLWPDRPGTRADANLRSAIWRMPEAVTDRLRRHGTTIELTAAWSVDLDDAVAAAARISGGADATDASRAIFGADLLPAWDETWLDLPRERHRQLRLHALETMAATELADGRPLDAVDTALVAVSAEPLRESAQHLLVKAHLAAGNRAAAICAFERFQDLLAADLGVDPGPAITATYDRARSRVTMP